MPGLVTMGSPPRAESRRAREVVSIVLLLGTCGRVRIATERKGQMDLGTIGVWTSYRMIGQENAGEAASLVEELGYGTFWLGGSPRLSTVRPLLEATERLVVATAIVNVWAYDPAELAAEYATLIRDFPERLLVG